MRYCHCGCGEELTKKSQRFAAKPHRIIWARKLSNRGVLPVYRHIRCKVCNGLMLLFPNTSCKSVCDNPKCQKITSDNRLKKATETLKRRREELDAMTERTPYLSQNEWWRRELRERVKEVTGL